MCGEWVWLYSQIQSASLSFMLWTHMCHIDQMNDHLHSSRTTINNVCHASCVLSIFAFKKNTPTRCCYCCSLSDRCLVKNGIQFYRKVKLRRSFFFWNGKQRMDAVNSGFATKTKVQPNANNILHEKRTE